MNLRTAAVLLFAVAAISCVSAPPPTAGAVRLTRNPRAWVEGRVLDVEGRPVAGIRVEALPRGADILWSAGCTTDQDGRFRLELFAPADYGFVLSKDGITVVTADPRDPAHEHVAVTPGERRGGVELRFLGSVRRKILSETGSREPPL